MQGRLVRMPPHEVLNQSRLAGARLRRNGHDAALAGVRHGEGLVQLLQLFFAL